MNSRNKKFHSGKGSKSRRYVYCGHCNHIVDEKKGVKTNLSYDKEKMGHVSKCSICKKEEPLVYCKTCNTVMGRRTKKVIIKLKEDLPSKRGYHVIYMGKKIPAVNLCSHCGENINSNNNLMHHLWAALIG